MEELFVKPVIYAPLVETFSGRSTVIVSGERGTGKTALTYELMRVASDKCLNIYVEDFSELRLGHSQDDLYRFLIDHLAEGLIKHLVNKRFAVARLDRDDKLLLSYLFKFHINAISLARIEAKIREVQIPFLKRAGIYFYNKIRGLLNYGVSAALNITSEIVRRHFPGLPAVDSEVSAEYFPALREGQVDDVQRAKANFNLLGRVASLAESVGFERVVFVLDKVDEEPRLENDAAEIAGFLECLLCDNKLLLHENIQFLIACWSIPLDQLRPKVRFQKLSVQKVMWDKENLERVLNQRLSIFSNESVKSINDILDFEARPGFENVLSLANGNPRDLWHLMDSVLKCQFEDGPDALKIASDSFGRGAAKFVKGFNFYEYYPRNAKARVNSMDIYSYIAHLQKIDGISFTKNQLSERAGTGGSTNNYVATMENIGLISRADFKGEAGAVVYEIRDPKVIFAKENGIVLEK